MGSPREKGDLGPQSPQLSWCRVRGPDGAGPGLSASDWGDGQPRRAALLMFSPQRGMDMTPDPSPLTQGHPSAPGHSQGLQRPKSPRGWATCHVRVGDSGEQLPYRPAADMCPVSPDQNETLQPESLARSTPAAGACALFSRPPVPWEEPPSTSWPVVWGVGGLTAPRARVDLPTPLPQPPSVGGASCQPRTHVLEGAGVPVDLVVVGADLGNDPGDSDEDADVHLHGKGAGRRRERGAERRGNR